MNTPAPVIGTLIDRPDLLPAPKPPMMKRMCSRCELVLGWVVCRADFGGHVTHGYCAACAAQLLAELEAWYPAEEAQKIAVLITAENSFTVS